MTKRERQLARVNEYRRKKQLDDVDAGFIYAVAIKMLRSRNYSYLQIANYIGSSKTQVQEYAKGATPNHVAGELLAGMLKDEFDPKGEKTWKEILPLTEAQKIGAQVTQSRQNIRTHRIK